MSAILLDLTAVERRLRDLQAHFFSINLQLNTRRPPLYDQVLEGMLSGYAYLNELQQTDTDLLAFGHSRQLLKLNHLVLCGHARPSTSECSQVLEQNKQRFYDDSNPGGVRAFMSHIANQLQSSSAWQRAAGVYLHILSEPQLFFEGNHRTGTLVMSHILMRAGLPPVVIGPTIAFDYFDPSARIKDRHKNEIRSYFELKRLRLQIAKLLERSADPGLLLPATCSSRHEPIG